jgi:hypothetical protein
VAPLQFPPIVAPDDRPRDPATGRYVAAEVRLNPLVWAALVARGRLSALERAVLVDLALTTDADGANRVAPSVTARALRLHRGDVLVARDRLRALGLIEPLSSGGWRLTMRRGPVAAEEAIAA